MKILSIQNVAKTVGLNAGTLIDLIKLNAYVPGVDYEENPAADDVENFILTTRGDICLTCLY